jgi:hypothetical protein
MIFTSAGAEIKLTVGNDIYRFWIHDQINHFVSPLYANEVSKPRCGQLYVFDSAEVTKIGLKTISHVCMAEVTQRLDKVLGQVNRVTES